MSNGHKTRMNQQTISKYSLNSNVQKFLNLLVKTPQSLNRLTAEKDCRILSALEKQLQKRHLSLRQMEAKLQQLRDDLAIGEKIAVSHRSQIKKYNQHVNNEYNKILSQKRF